jgi:hypothetical protein
VSSGVIEEVRPEAAHGVGVAPPDRHGPAEPDLTAPGPRWSDGGARSGLAAWASRYNAGLTVAAVCLAPILYLAFIDRDATNSLYLDDWSVVPVVHAALHGHLSLSQLWSQYNESRLFTGTSVLVLFGFLDRLDTRTVVFFGAAAFIASYAGVLTLVRRYFGRPLTPIPVLAIGVTWFSLADYQNALWAFQVSWYLTVLFFVLMVCALLLPARRGPVWLAVAALLAVAASLSTVQGFLCWPVGIVCLLWNSPWRRARSEVVLWLVAMIVTVTAYLHGYAYGEGNACAPAAPCTTSFELHHPITTLGFFFALIGNVLPDTTNAYGAVGVDSTRFVLVGLVLFAAALYVLVQSWRHRASSERLPLPGLLIAFGLLFDLTIVVGRGGTGASDAVFGDRYVMANLILLTGIVVWVLARLSTHLLPEMRRARGTLDVYLVPALFALLLLVQVIDATGAGLASATTSRYARQEQAQILVNAQRNPALDKDRSCQLFLTLEFAFRGTSTFKSYLHDATEDGLAEFQPDSDRYFHALGPPPLPSGCRLP